MNKVIDKGFRSCRFVSTIVKHPVYGVVLCAHSVNGEPRISTECCGCNNIPSFLQQTAPITRLNPARPSHPGHSTILLRPESPSGMCVKLRTVAASNNRGHAPQSLLLLVRATYMWCSLRTSCSW